MGICDLYQVCPAPKEIVSVILGGIFGGVVAGVFAIMIYKHQKNAVIKTNKYNVSTMLLNEIKRIYHIMYLDVKTFDRNTRCQRFPKTEIYKGLLNSGDIKYFDDSLQNDLDELYTYFQETPFTPNAELGESVIKDLELIKYKNKHNCFVIYCHKLKSIKNRSQSI